MQKSIVLLSILFLTSFMFSQENYVSDTKSIKLFLENEILTLKKEVDKSDPKTFMKLKRLQDIGSWKYVAQQITSNAKLDSFETTILKARQAWLLNDFFLMESLLKQLSDTEKKTAEALRLFATLSIESWELQKAVDICYRVLKDNPNDIETETVLGRGLILQKDYEKALEIAENRIKKNPDNAAGYFLKADVFFWNQKPDEADKVLEKALAIDPLNANGRFFYGYAIWRRIDATQLDAMMAQWELALELNPLHFQTHWHVGNGHTNLTFSDYVDSDEDAIRLALEEADSLFMAGRSEAALQVIADVAIKFPKSVIPGMHKASLLYNDFDAENRKELLDEAEEIFINILNDKKHYGPAHNGLAAVIKSKRIPYLQHYEEYRNKFMNTDDISNLDDMLEVFPDVGYYSGHIVKGMSWHQLYTAVVYFPFLVELERGFVIPPLHKDLAIAMKSPRFRNMTTFDNRQWMDIRGVGSGAAGIGYVERGAYGERNVLLHEFVHLFHGTILTDQENRKIRSLYYNAMENGLTLDYYSQNNESEYLAQTYPAFYEPEKVHPLDFKSMNTTKDLREKDPKMYAFLKDFVAKEQAYLDGDKTAMASNWAQVYVNIARNRGRVDKKLGYENLEKSLSYDKDYLPSYITYANFLIEEKKFDEAQEKLNIAKKIDDSYAPIYRTEGDLSKSSQPEAIEEQAELYKKAYEIETDFMEQAVNSRTLRSFYFERGMLNEALATADEYVKNGARLSTYLRDAIEESQSFAAWQRGLLGYNGQEEILAYLVAQRPNNYVYRLRYVDVLLASGKDQKALDNILSSYENLLASRVRRSDFELRIARGYKGLGDHVMSQEYVEKINSSSNMFSDLDELQRIRLLTELGFIKESQTALNSFKINDNANVLLQSSLSLTNALFLLKKGNVKAGVELLENTLDIYPYNVEAVNMLKNVASTNSAAQKSLKKGIGSKAQNKIKSIK